MERNQRHVKQPRRYDSTRRREQAEQTRGAILDVARRRFLDDGFTPTTVAAIAGEVGVSVDTVYKTFGGKPGLVRAICDQGLAGAGPVHAEQRSDALQISEPDPLRIMQGLGLLAAEVAPRVAPIMLLVRDAAVSDPDMAKLKAELDAQRLERMTHNARNLARAGHLRDDVSVERAGEIMWTYTAPELYELLVIVRGWTAEQLGAFTADALTAALLPRRPSRRRASRRTP
ncbi:MAG TPA: helix-turn-helix domain-containing protein [Acidimicrobiales bacterium]|nr:helix-turn-helix domain-containing protein [Acidimicrobiales bacterium]